MNHYYISGCLDDDDSEISESFEFIYHNRKELNSIDISNVIKKKFKADGYHNISNLIFTFYKTTEDARI